ncbi:unnamed protein product [Arabidopsis lyrata]|uniref:Uncharacterized protein n=1 Tax=Arabidopsis lyrata subsp. lyrata TaxID=81972 RepID=D7LHI5_ARALL|nr:hypothetical protein ARALYDRAFT_900947 [Arabidopsis lyrata subsp. lyrata]CAH8263338.1 unnamed protein product [Arabidopsis lyrata]
MRKSKVPKSNSANLEQAYRSLISASRGLSRTLSPSLPESQPPPPQLESQSPSMVVSSFPAPVTPSPPSQEEIQTRSRNREEIRRVHDCYKRLKSSIGQRDGGGCSANLEQAYRSLISASRGLSRTLSPSLSFDLVLPIG